MKYRMSAGESRFCVFWDKRAEICLVRGCFSFGCSYGME
jgi:hypothetical protein